MCSKKTLAIAKSLALQASYTLAEEAVTELDEMVVEEEAKHPASTQYNGSLRWSLVAPDETQVVETVYGPFSAEYSGNAMGGVVNIDTRMPTEREFHIEAGVFAQDFDHLGTDETYIGHREFISIGDKFDDLSVYLFHNHLENASQPMTLSPGRAWF